MTVRHDFFFLQNMVNLKDKKRTYDYDVVKYIDFSYRTGSNIAYTVLSEPFLM